MREVILKAIDEMSAYLYALQEEHEGFWCSSFYTEGQNYLTTQLQTFMSEEQIDIFDEWCLKATTEEIMAEINAIAKGTSELIILKQ